MHKLLLADDSVTIQRVIELTFADEDIQVIAVGDGRQAIDRVQADRPDIVLADVGMPERDGYEVAAFVKGHSEFAHIPVLLLTGAFEPIDEKRARAAGCDGVLVKPFEPQLVISRVKDLISGRRATVQQGQFAAPIPAAQVPASGAQPPSRQGESSSSPAPQTSGSIEDYFDRLDAAFSSLDSPGLAGEQGAQPSGVPSFGEAPAEPEPAAPGYSGLAEELAGWDPDILSGPGAASPATPQKAADDFSWGLDGQNPVPFPPASPAPVQAASDGQAPAAAVPAPASAPVSPTHAIPPSAATLAEAFASLLAAEQGQAVAPASTSRRATDDELIEQITERVITRMSDRAVQERVIDVAERLVREEIDRIKSLAR